MGDIQERIFGVFLGLGAIAFAFGDTVLPEVQVKPVHCTSLPCALDCPDRIHHCTHAILYSYLGWLEYVWLQAVPHVFVACLSWAFAKLGSKLFDHDWQMRAP